MSELLPYDPGVIPTKPAFRPGQTIYLKVDELPPYKDTSRSIRNVTHPRYESFVALRQAATRVMDGRAWYFGPVRLWLLLRATELHPRKAPLDYMSGIMDTLDGSSGATFTYLPIVYEDDCQVVSGSIERVDSEAPHYELMIELLDGDQPPDLLFDRIPSQE